MRIDDDLISDAKQIALDRGKTLSEIVDEALRVFLVQQRSKQPFQLHVVEGMGLQPGVDLSDNAALADLMDQKEGLPH